MCVNTNGKPNAMAHTIAAAIKRGGTKSPSPRAAAIRDAATQGMFDAPAPQSPVGAGTTQQNNNAQRAQDAAGAATGRRRPGSRNMISSGAPRGGNTLLSALGGAASLLGS